MLVGKFPAKSFEHCLVKIISFFKEQPLYFSWLLQELNKL